jgi:hypothetical protein
VKDGRQTYASSSSSCLERPANGSAACAKPGAAVLWPWSRGRVVSKPKKDMLATLLLTSTSGADSNLHGVH